MSQKIDNLVHAALVRLTPEMGVEGELAESWEARGYRHFVFRLRKNLRFQDGSPLTADDVVRAIGFYRKGTPHAVVFKHITGASSEGRRTVKLETDSPQPFLLQDLPLLKVFKRDGERIIAAGRYRIVSDEAHELRAAAADTYFEPVPADGLREVRFRYVVDDTTRYQLLARGDANVVISGLSLTKTEYLRRHPLEGLQVIDAPGINYGYLCFNLRDPRLAKLKVRQAIAQAIDVESILKYRVGDFGYRARGILAPVHRDYYEPDVVHYDYDPDAASRLLDEAGYPRGRDGWRFKLYFKTTTEKFGNEMARILANELRRVGIDVRLEVVEAGTFFAQVGAGKFEIFHSRWIGVNSPGIYFRAFHSSQAHGGANRGGYSNPEMDRLLDLAMNEVDDSKRRRYFSEVQKLAARDLPYVSLWHWNNTFIGSKAMRHVVMYPNGDYRTIADVRIDKP